jgi:catechol 2,3-dioxygenase-like lactoylglutathione lyase family enzyme
MAKITFHHVCMLTGSREMADSCLWFYRINFGMALAYSGVSETNDFIFLADNVNLGMPSFEIIGKTAEGREVVYLEEHGAGLDHICFVVDDIQYFYKKLVSDGVEFHVLPYEFQGSWIAWCKDPAGVDVELLEINVDFPETESNSKAPNAQYNHVSILTGTRELAQVTENFYRKHFGMTELLRGGPSEEMDWVYLQDGCGESPLWLEIIGAAIYDNEKAFIKNHGPGLEHHCFVVDDAEGFFTWLKEQSVKVETDIIEFVGAKMFYVLDPIGVLIQVLQMPKGLL